MIVGFPQHPQFIVKREGPFQHMVYAAFETFTGRPDGIGRRELVPTWVVSGPFITRGIALRVADDVKRQYHAAHQGGRAEGLAPLTSIKERLQEIETDDKAAASRLGAIIVDVREMIERL